MGCSELYKYFCLKIFIFHGGILLLLLMELLADESEEVSEEIFRRGDEQNERMNFCRFG